MNDKDLLGQADGLMRRHAVGSDTAAVPILTDLIDAPPAAAPIDSTLAPAEPALQEPPPPPIEGLDAAAIEARIMADVDRRLAEEMERVRHQLAGTVADAVRQALSDRPVK